MNEQIQIFVMWYVDAQHLQYLQSYGFENIKFETSKIFFCFAGFYFGTLQ